MQASIERFVMVNLMMNLLVLVLAARLSGYVRVRRILAAAVLGTVWAVLAAVLPHRWMRGVWVQAGCMTVMSAVLFGRRRGLRASNWGALLLSTALAAGVVLTVRVILPNGQGGLIASGLLLALIILLTRGAALRMPSGNRLWIRVTTRMGSAELNALVDTGNRLTEPMSGLPVMIVEARMLRGVLDAHCLQEGALPPGFRLVRYGVLGGGGQMRVFRPQQVEIRRGCGWTEAPDVWVGVYPGELPPRVDALAPPLLCVRK